MKAKLKRIEARAETFTKRFDRGEITEAVFLAEIRRLTDKAGEIMEQMAA